MYNSYKNLFRIKWKIYSLDNKHPLPRAIPLDGVVVFLIGWLPSRFLSVPVAAVFDQPVLGVNILFDILLTWLILNYDPQGRSFPVFIYDFLAFILRPKRSDFAGQSLTRHRRIRVWWEAFDLEE